MADPIDKFTEKVEKPEKVEKVEKPEKVEPASANLTIQDLSTALQIIQVVGSRGAIKAEEMGIVGALYNKLKAFLDAAGATAAQLEKVPDPVPSKIPSKKVPKKEISVEANDTVVNAEIIGGSEK